MRENNPSTVASKYFSPLGGLLMDLITLHDIISYHDRAQLENFNLDRRNLSRHQVLLIPKEIYFKKSIFHFGPYNLIMISLCIFHQGKDLTVLFGAH